MPRCTVRVNRLIFSCTRLELHQRTLNRSFDCWLLPSFSWKSRYERMQFICELNFVVFSHCLATVVVKNSICPFRILLFINFINTLIHNCRGDSRCNRPVVRRSLDNVISTGRWYGGATDFNGHSHITSYSGSDISTSGCHSNCTNRCTNYWDPIESPTLAFSLSKHWDVVKQLIPVHRFSKTRLTKLVTCGAQFNIAENLFAAWALGRLWFTSRSRRVVNNDILRMIGFFCLINCYTHSVTTLSVSGRSR